MKKVIRRRVRKQRPGVNVVGDVHAVVATNVDRRATTNVVSTRSRARVVQRSGRTEQPDDTDRA